MKLKKAYSDYNDPYLKAFKNANKESIRTPKEKLVFTTVEGNESSRYLHYKKSAVSYSEAGLRAPSSFLQRTVHDFIKSARLYEKPAGLLRKLVFTIVIELTYKM